MNSPQAPQKNIDELAARDIYRLIHWQQSLHQDVDDIYRSTTWQIGEKIARFILWILGQAPGPTARDHVERLRKQFQTWRTNYLAQYTGKNGILPYFPWHSTPEYAEWINRYDTLDEVQTAKRRLTMATWSYQPLFSLLMTVPPGFKPAHFKETLTSVRAQLYPGWEFLIAYPESEANSPKIADLFRAFATDHRFTFIPAAATESRADALNRLLAQAQGDFIGLLAPGSQLTLHALYEIVALLNRLPESDIIYSDEDKLTEQGQRCDPYFKPDWSPDLFYAQHYLKQLTVYRRALVEQVGGFEANYPEQEDYALILRLLESEQISPDRIRHIPRVLSHSRQVAENVPSAMKALNDHFQRAQQTAQVKPTPGGWRVIYHLPIPLPLVSIIIPTRDRVKLLRGLVEDLLQRTDYPPLEILIINNDSQEPSTLAYLREIQAQPQVRVLSQPGNFNYSRLNNFGVAQAKGEIICLLNNDLRVIHPDWLKEMLSHAARPEIGAVGAKLYYPDNTLQHAGVIAGLGGAAGHLLKGALRQAPAYQWKPFLTQNYSAVTSACLVMRRAVFQESGGFNEKHLPVAFNDVDLCLRLRQRGYRILWTPYAELYHLESASRGSDNTLKKYLRLRRELKYLRKQWAEVLENDPYYNPNLTLQYEDFSLAYPPRLEE